jgi:GT2 family glycosyltransferase
VIPCWNQSWQTKDCIKVLSKNVDVPFEVIVVNNGSTDDTKDFLNNIAEGILKENSNFIKFTTIHQPQNRFLSNAWNVGIKHSISPYIMFIANDVLIPPKVCSFLIDRLKEDPKRGAVSPFYTEDQTFLGADNFLANYNKIPKSEEVVVDWHWSVCQVFTREMWEDVGEWDEKLRTHTNDNDVGQRIAIKGYRPTTWKSFVAYHHYGSLARNQMKSEKGVASVDSVYYLSKWSQHTDKWIQDLKPEIIEKAKNGWYISEEQKNYSWKAWEDYNDGLA